ncbi:WecB/TagA/CpsF family glycosyltransferase [Streptomyces sp. NBC_01304]|uniref:WecB/TagA/CpsF family glycosyltransferase n=1 Tax=Streptomyces sp. NBC_01304 TaxID=2903818 RepID=UPI002E139E49|nr:WecB/TagA/CpsF family glycosyltransferase [Streptomyces sp. NBC_01304]
MTTTTPDRRPQLPPTGAGVAAATVLCTGVPIAAVSPEEAAAAVIRLAAGGQPADVHLCNAYTLALADKDRVLKARLSRATLNLPDGQGVVWANRLVHRDRTLPRDRVYGPDLLLDVFRTGQAVGLRHYLLGSTRDVLDGLTAELKARYPRAQIVGTEAPPFRELTAEERQSQARRIAASGAQIVWVGLGTPKQDHEAALLAREHPAVYVAVGAAFDFISGNKPQAPLWMQHNGLEWLFRMCSEPRRIGRRVLWGHPRFVRAVLSSQATPTKGSAA